MSPAKAIPEASSSSALLHIKHDSVNEDSPLSSPRMGTETGVGATRNLDVPDVPSSPQLYPTSSAGNSSTASSQTAHEPYNDVPGVHSDPQLLPKDIPGRASQELATEQEGSEVLPSTVRGGHDDVVNMSETRPASGPETTAAAANFLRHPVTSGDTETGAALDVLPRLKGFDLWHRKWSTLAYAVFILMCNLALPCILYYVLEDHTSLSDHALLGISSATLGISSSFDNPFRMWKLWKHRDLYGPLNDDVVWHLDCSMHLYSFSLLPIFAIPLAVASSVNPPMHDFFLMSTPMLVAVPGLFFLVSLFRPKNKIWMSSDPPGSTMKPGVFYLFEDIGAVDFRHGKEFRKTLHERYQASPVYRDMMWYMTLWWAFGCAFYFALIAAITWTVPFEIAFGLVLGLLFAWLTGWAILSVLFARYFHNKEARWLQARNAGQTELAYGMTRAGESERRLSEKRERRRRLSVEGRDKTERSG